jgi:TPR repeat protein
MMTVRRAAATIVLIAGLPAGGVASAAAQAPLQLNPPTAQAPGKPALKPTPKSLPRKGAAPPAASVDPSILTAEVPARDADMAYGAFQRGFYITAFSIATRRAEERNDVKAMTLLGELYANGFGIERDDKKAAEWYRLAADRGDRAAMFALGMFYLGGRLGTVNSEQGAKLLAAAAKLGHAAASYDLALLYLEGKVFPQDFARAAELFRIAADAGNPEAQYALATFYKEGRGVPTDLAEAARLLAAAALVDNTDAQVEYAIALFNGTGVDRNEPLAAALLRKAARKGNPVAQNRLANILAVGRGLKADAMEAIKWHMVAKAGGVSDIPLDAFVQQQAPDIRTAAEKAAKPWVDAIKEAREQRS